jgi:hypothetical protein
MAGKTSAKGCVITLTDPTTPRTISGDVKQYSFNQSAGLNEVTGFGDGGQNFIPGLPVHDLTLDCYYNNTATTGVWTVLRAIMAAGTACTITLKPEASALTLTFICFPESVPITGQPSGNVEIGSVKFVQMGATAGTWA